MKIWTLITFAGVIAFASASPQLDPAIQQPAPYSFAYGVSAGETGDIKEHKQSVSQDGITQGEYRWLQPNGLYRVTRYTVDGESGYRAVVSEEPGDGVPSYYKNSLQNSESSLDSFNNQENQKSVSRFQTKNQGSKRPQNFQNQVFENEQSSRNQDFRQLQGFQKQEVNQVRSFEQKENFQSQNVRNENVQNQEFNVRQNFPNENRISHAHDFTDSQSQQFRRVQNLRNPDFSRTQNQEKIVGSNNFQSHQDFNRPQNFERLPLKRTQALQNEHSSRSSQFQNQDINRRLQSFQNEDQSKSQTFQQPNFQSQDSRSNNFQNQASSRFQEFQNQDSRRSHDVQKLLSSRSRSENFQNQELNSRSQNFQNKDVNRPQIFQSRDSARKSQKFQSQDSTSSPNFQNQESIKRFLNFQNQGSIQRSQNFQSKNARINSQNFQNHNAFSQFRNSVNQDTTSRTQNFPSRLFTSSQNSHNRDSSRRFDTSRTHNFQELDSSRSQTFQARDSDGSQRVQNKDFTREESIQNSGPRQSQRFKSQTLAGNTEFQRDFENHPVADEGSRNIDSRFRQSPSSRLSEDFNSSNSRFPTNDPNHGIAVVLARSPSQFRGKSN